MASELREHHVAFAMDNLMLEFQDLDHLKASSGTPPTERTDGTDEQHLSSIRSNASSTGSSNTPKSPSFQSNLMRKHVDRDPFERYEKLQMLGEGSMGSVSLVRKHAHAVGGSARIDAQARMDTQRRYDECFRLPFVGGCFAWILKDRAALEIEQAGKPNTSARDILVDSASTSNELLSSLTDSVNTGDDDKVYAMKYIHYNLIKDKTLVDELRNEVALLRTLDHPHIVRIHSTYDWQGQMFVVMEAFSGGDLYTREPYTEAEAARIVASILSALSYMHGKGV
eukprot:scaffold34698_cov173-Amphora_coffeaeformis.AAC.11